MKLHWERSPGGVCDDDGGAGRPVTYNFDPEQWYANHKAALDARHERGELDDQAYTAELEALDRRYEELVARLDGTFVIP